MQVSLALDRLLETVAEVAKDMRDEGTQNHPLHQLLDCGREFFHRVAESVPQSNDQSATARIQI